jgi:predicted transglutaminase-like cysteine proteinase
LRAPPIRLTRLALEMSFLLAIMTLDGCATATAQFDPLPLGKTVSAPTGFLQFCQRRPDQCQTSAPVIALDRPSQSDGPGMDEEAASLAVPAKPLVNTPPLADQNRDDFTRLGASPTLPSDLDYLPSSFVADKAAKIPPAISIFGQPVGDASGSRPHVHGTYSLSPEGALGGRLRFSPELAAEIGEVNVAINRAIKPRTDMEAFGIDNYWTLPLSDGPRAEGNCKHYALEKRRRLVDDGVPSNALSLAIVVTSKNEVHAVLVVSTDQGDVVMDNLTDEVRSWRQTDYRWLARQTPGDPLHWVEVRQAS